MRDPDVRSDRLDRLAALVIVYAFSVSLGIGIVTIPLLALASGYDAPSVGFLVAIAAAMQFGVRLAMPALLGRVPDRSLIAVGSGLMLAGFGFLLFSTSLVVFVVAQACQGAGRAIFWTSSQTHAVRDQPWAIRRLVDISIASTAGTLTGPALAGVLATSGLAAALAAAVAGAAVAALGSATLRRVAPFDRTDAVGSRRLIGRAGVDLACWASAVSGVWMSMLSSYIPVILVGAGTSPVGIGWLVSASEAAAATALISLRRIARERLPVVVRLGAAVILVCLVAIAISHRDPWIYAALLVVGGSASGAVTTLAPAMASLAASPDEQGDVLSLAGMFRAGALFATPASVGILLGYVALAPSIALIGMGAGVSGLLVSRRGRDGSATSR
jgi:MFS transporter